MSEIISGTATTLTQGTDYNYTTGANNTVVAIQNQLFSFRIDNKPILFRTRTFPSITEGDRLAVIGHDKNGTFQASALKNLTTGAGHYMPTTGPLALGSVAIIMGLLISTGMFLLGLPLLALGGWVIYKAWGLKKDNETLKAFNA